jgi:hypothetical protein
MDDDLIGRRYYQTYKILPSFKNWNFNLSIAGDELKRVSQFKKSASKWHEMRSIYESLEEIAKKTKRKNDKILEKMN